MRAPSKPAAPGAEPLRRAEFGIIAAKGTARARELMSLVDTDERVPAIARDPLLQLVDQIRDTERKIEAFDKQILSLARENEVCRRLMTY